MISILVNTILAFTIQAQATELHWVQLPGAPQKLVMAVEEGQSQEQALQNYIAELDGHKDLTAFIQELKRTPLHDLRWGQIAPSSKKRVLLLANNIQDMGRYPNRVMSFQKTFEETGAEVFVLPVAATKPLTRSSEQNVLELISDEMDVVTAMGGADISPDLYGRYNTFSRNVNHERDVWEARVLKNVIAKGKAFVLGICRGHQLTAVTQGFTLVQDIPSFIDTDIDHENDNHNIEILGTRRQMFKNLTGQSGEIEVNSLHHQAVQMKESPKLIPAAVSHDGIVEAFEFANGMGFTVQFHPEMMEEQWAKDILRNSVKASANQSKNKCEALLKAS